MNNILSRIGLISISLLVLYIIKKLFNCIGIVEEGRIYKIDEDDED